jgi:hypothetical protein
MVLTVAAVTVVTAVTAVVVAVVEQECALHQVVNRTSLVCLAQHQVTAAVLRSSRALHALQRGETQALL